MRKLPTYLTAVILTCTVPRVADFGIVYMHAWPVIAWAFSLVIALGVWVSAYFTREHVTSTDPKRLHQSNQVRRQAGLWLLLFVVVDGGFNLLDVWLALPAGSMLALQVGALVYGAFPTVASAALGSLQGAVDRLPAGNKRPVPVVSDIISGADAWAKRWAAQMRKKPAPAAVVSVPVTPLFICQRCEWHSDGTLSDKRQQAQSAGHASAHTRADARVKA